MSQFPIDPVMDALATAARLQNENAHLRAEVAQLRSQMQAVQQAVRYPVVMYPTNQFPSIQMPEAQPTPAMQIQPVTQPSRGPNPGSQNQQMAKMVKDALSKLNMPRPNPSRTFDEALTHLQSNVSDYTLFLTEYLNGRIEHLTTELKPQIRSTIRNSHAGEDEAKQVTDRIVKIFQEGVKYTDQNSRGLGSDIIGPMGLTLWALVEIWERQG